MTASRNGLPPVERTAWRLIFYGLGLGALASFHHLKLPPVLPMLIERYHYGHTMSGGFMAIYAAVGLAVSAWLGIRMQRLGLRAFVPLGIILFVLGSGLTMAWPEHAWIVLLARGIEGIAFAIMAIAAPVIITTAAAPRHLPIAIGIFAAWVPVGQLLASMLALPIVGADRWQPLWWIGIGLSLILGAFAFRLTARHTAAGTGKALAVRTGAAVHPDQRRALYLNAAIFMLWSTEMFAYFTWLPEYLVQERGLSLSASQWPYSLTVVGILMFTLISGWLMRQGVPAAPMMALGLLVQAVVWITLPWLDNPVLSLLGVAAFGIAGGIIPTALFAGPALILGQANARGWAFGVIMSGRNFGVLLGPVLLPPVLHAFGDWRMVGALVGALTLLAAAGGLWFGPLARRAAHAIERPLQTTSQTASR
jgi:MFS family permease